MLAALLLDGWIFGNVARNGLAKPLMLIYEGLYEEKLMPTFPASDTQFDQRSWQMDRLDTARMEATLHRSGGYRLFIRGASHWNFTDRPLYSPIRSWGYAGKFLHNSHTESSIFMRCLLLPFSQGQAGTAYRETSG
jgi:hypothetical protein